MRIQQVTNCTRLRREDDSNNADNAKDEYNNNTDSDASFRFSFINLVNETETDSSDISLGDSDDADDDLTDTSESFDTESTSESELDECLSFQECPGPPSCHSLYTIVEEEDSCCDEGLGPDASMPGMTDLQEYFLMLGELTM